MYQLIDLHVRHYKIWATQEKKQRYDYVLSPWKSFPVSGHIQSQLDQIGLLVKGYQEGLISLQQEVSSKHFEVERMFKQALGGLPFIGSDRIVPICKVDCMIGQNDQVYLAEIDAYNPRGLAYSGFLQNICGMQGGEGLYPGVLGPIASWVRSQGKESITWLYTHKERYYAPWIEVFAQILHEKTGVSLKAYNMEEMQESEVSQDSLYLIPPWGVAWRQELFVQKKLLEIYARYPEHFYYPLVPWLSTKAFFGVLSCMKKGDSLASFFSHQGYSTYMPHTIVVAKPYRDQVEEFIAQYPEVLLKQHVSSGMKGVVHSSRPEFQATLQHALCMKKSQYTLQEGILQKIFEVPVYEPCGQVVHKDYYVRLCAYIDPQGNVLDVEMTGRTTPDVHGAPDCIQLSCSKV